PLHVKTLSRGAARKLIEGGAVYLNRKRCQQNGKIVRAGDKVRVMEAPESAQERGPQEFRFTAEHIIFEDQDWIVVNKPPALPTHETIDSSRHHLVRSLQNFLGERDKILPARVYLGIHHRLDVNTSGAILFTKRKEANSAVSQAFQERHVQKTYLAASLGELSEPRLIKSFLAESRQNKRKIESVRSGGKYAETAIRSVETKMLQARRVSLIEASPKTGRTHQIRVHLAENDLPILGDETYGVRFPGVKRVLLHAWKLELMGKSFRAPLPDDFRILDFHEPGE
ncbi:MAG: RluA family pseudouridine synthase, partial [Bdellovibrionota bacterium]